MSPHPVSANMCWKIKTAEFARITLNPLRLMSENQKILPNPDKDVITLQMGDPTVFGNFKRSEQSVDAIRKALEKDKFSYNCSVGSKEARQAVAEYCRNQGNVTAEDVILTSGCSAALEMCFVTLAEPGDNILTPRPCFNYTTWLHGSKIEPRFYDLDPSNDWEINLEHLESQIDEKTRGLLINNIGNPCGNIYTKSHILDVLKIAERYQIPIISDDIYEHFVFPGNEYFSISALSKNVPVLSCGGLTKRFIMPGIRMGWIVIHDRHNALKELKQGLVNISGRNFGPNCTIQHALPNILRNTPQSFFDDILQRVAVSLLIICITQIFYSSKYLLFSTESSKHCL